MNWSTAKLALTAGLMVVFVGGGLVAQPGPDLLWTGEACPDPVVTCGTLPLGVIVAIGLAVAVVEVGFGGERLGFGGESE